MICYMAFRLAGKQELFSQQLPLSQVLKYYIPLKPSKGKEQKCDLNPSA